MMQPQIQQGMQPSGSAAGGTRGSRDALAASLRRHYFTAEYAAERGLPSVDAYLGTELGRSDHHDHISGRLDGFRKAFIPWLASQAALQGARILEIGCGTGSSTVALAEKGAQVVAVDVDEAGLAVARDRCAAHGVSAEFVRANASEVRSLLERPFDVIIFFASLEHMTHAERLTAMTDTWALLPPGALWCIVETPNRLWFYDQHTSHLPFFNWLPDDLALMYSRFSPRATLANSYRETTASALQHFLRRGRGLSYHEFQLTMGDPAKLDVVSDMDSFLRRRQPIRNLARRLLGRDRFGQFLRQTGPRLHPGFYKPSLDLLIRKPR